MAEKPLSITDQRDVSQAIISFIAAYPALPFAVNNETVQWQAVSAAEGIGVITQPGAAYIKKYTRGAFRGHMPFRIMLRMRAADSKSRLYSQRLIEDIAVYLETCSATFTNEVIKDLKITRTSQVYITAADENGSQIYICDLDSTYYSKGGTR